MTEIFYTNTPTQRRSDSELLQDRFWKHRLLPFVLVRGRGDRAVLDWWAPPKISDHRQATALGVVGAAAWIAAAHIGHLSPATLTDIVVAMKLKHVASDATAAAFLEHLAALASRGIRKSSEAQL